MKKRGVRINLQRKQTGDVVLPHWWFADWMTWWRFAAKIREDHRSASMDMVEDTPLKMKKKEELQREEEEDERTEMEIQAEERKSPVESPFFLYLLTFYFYFYFSLSLSLCRGYGGSQDDFFFFFFFFYSAVSLYSFYVRKK